MSNPIDYIHKQPHRSKQILGISYKQFLQLVQQAFLRQSQQHSRLEQTKIRINAPGGGRKPILSMSGGVGLCLFYLRHLPTFEILGLQFGISKTSLGGEAGKNGGTLFRLSVCSNELFFWFEGSPIFFAPNSKNDIFHYWLEILQ